MNFDDTEYPCPECGRMLNECWGTDPMTGIDEHTFQCAGHDCLSCFEADEIIEPAPAREVMEGDDG